VSTLTVRLPETKHQGLEAFARARGKTEAGLVLLVKFDPGVKVGFSESVEV